MKKLLYLSFFAAILGSNTLYTKQNSAHAEKFLCHNTFASQVYVSVYTDAKPTHCLVAAGGYQSISYHGTIEKITINFQLPAYPIATIEESDIPDKLKMMTINPSRKILLS
jgi:hypothetical protein